MAKPVSANTFHQWLDQDCRDASRWHAAKGIETGRLLDYEAGYRQGYLAALSALKLHNHVTMTDRRD